MYRRSSAGGSNKIRSHQRIVRENISRVIEDNPAHSYDGIAESYFCLSGSVFENDARVDAPGSLIFNPPGRNRGITVAAHESCLLACAWVGSQKTRRAAIGVQAFQCPPEDLLNHWRRTPTAKVATQHRRVIRVIYLQQQLCVF